ncbi:hypothetical protein ACQKWADRAFT_276808 [Trichoderma austrokoningii]
MMRLSLPRIPHCFSLQLCWRAAVARSLLDAGVVLSLNSRQWRRFVLFCRCFSAPAYLFLVLAGVLLVRCFCLNSLILPVSVVEPPLRPACMRRLPNHANGEFHLSCFDAWRRRCRCRC